MKWSVLSNMTIKATMDGLCEYINQVSPPAAWFVSLAEPMTEITSDLLIPGVSCFNFESETGTLQSHHQTKAQKSTNANNVEPNILSVRDFIICLR